jgi:hypothetical protein
MKTYRVTCYKTLQNDEGHNFKCPQKQYDVSSWDPVEALALAQQKLGRSLEDADCIEVAYIPCLGPAPESTQR